MASSPSVFRLSLKRTAPLVSCNMNLHNLTYMHFTFSDELQEDSEEKEEKEEM